MISEDLVAQRIAIDSYHELIGCLGELDPTTSDMLKEILAVWKSSMRTSWQNC